jgi:DNA-damage-inducible protein D
MSDQPPVPAASNTFERIKRVSPEGNESWSARDLARVLEYSVFRNFLPVIEKAKEACVKSGHSVAGHFAEMRNMVEIGSGAQRPLEDWALSLAVQKRAEAGADGKFGGRMTGAKCHNSRPFTPC